MSETIDSEQVNNALALPDAGMIETLTFDVLRQTITFQVHQTWNPHHEEWHMAVFEGVASFYAVLGSGEGRFREVFSRHQDDTSIIGE